MLCLASGFSKPSIAHPCFCKNSVMCTAAAALIFSRAYHLNLIIGCKAAEDNRSISYYWMVIKCLTWKGLIVNFLIIHEMWFMPRIWGQKDTKGRTWLRSRRFSAVATPPKTDLGILLWRHLTLLRDSSSPWFHRFHVLLSEQRWCAMGNETILKTM